MEGLPEPAVICLQMRTQARQLADLLAARQAELERREANLHAQTAGWEQQARDARLWWNDRLEELARLEAARDSLLGT